MNNTLLSLYHTLPYPLKSVAATIRGHQLKSWRYGKDTEQLIADAIHRETWTDQQWQNWQENQLENVLHRAATQVPYYRRYWAARRKAGDKSSCEVLANWPILEKDQLRQQPLQFLADDCKPKQMFHEHTSGTSGTPLTIYQSKETVRFWYALFEARWRRWYGISNKDRWAIFGGQLIAHFDRQTQPYWVWNAGMHQLYCSVYHLKPATIQHYLNALISHQITYIYGYASALYTLAQIAMGQNLQPPKIKLLLNNAEPLYDHQRDKIESFFQAPIYDTYGMSEAICAASECKHGIMHLWPEAGVYEVLDKENHQVKKNQSGRLISTGLINPNMPLIRYEIGDFGALDWDFQPCKCGRTLPKLVSIEGRTDDLIITKDGRTIGRLDPIFKQGFHIREAQIIQEDYEKFLIQYVKDDNFCENDLHGMRDSLCQRVGDVDVTFKAVDKIPRTKSGKIKAVISKVKQSD